MSDLAKETQGFQHQKPLKPASLWWMYVPALATVFIFMIFPFVKGAFITFTNWNGFSQTYQWVGVTQYKRLFTDPDTWLVVKNTLLYGIGSTFFQNMLGLLYALLLNQLSY